MRRDRRATATAVLSSGQSLVDTLIRVAWPAVLLGLTMDALLIVIAASFGEAEGRPMLAGMVWGWPPPGPGRRPWASPGCWRHPWPSTSPARCTRAPCSPPALGLLKGVEYACLGAALGLISLRPWGGALAYAAAGLGTGILFGGTILALHEWAAREPIPADVVVSRAVNEVLFPVGCSLVIFAAQVLGKRVAA